MSSSTDSVDIPGVGTARLLPMSLFGKIELVVNDAPVKVDGFGRFELWRDEGPVKGRVAFAFTRSKPDLVVGAERYQLGEPFPLWLVVLSALPLVLIAIGGGIGAMFGLIGFMLNRRFLGMDVSAVVKVLGIVGTTAATYIIAIAASTAIHMAFL